MLDKSNRSSPQTSAALSDAQRFLDLLTRGSACTFQVFDDSPRKRLRLNKILHGTLTAHAATLMQLNEQGAGIFVMVNVGDGKGRKRANVRAVRALFVDLDGAPLEPVLNGPITPHVVTETSPGRWHAFWLVDGAPLESFSHLQGQLAKMFDADRSVKDLCRVMRLPGFVHNKQQPYQSRIVRLDDKPAIPVQEFVDAFGISPIIPVGQRNTSLFKATAGFKHAGIPKAAAAERIAKINAAHTSKPLPDEEVQELVDRAYSYETNGFSMIPHRVIDTPAFEALSGAASKLLFYAMRRHRPRKEFALPYSEFAHVAGLKNRQQFNKARDELIDAGFLVRTRQYVASLDVEGRRCALYRIADHLLRCSAFSSHE
jgi:hypothetical protein